MPDRFKFLPAHLARIAADCAAFRGLIFPPSQLFKARAGFSAPNRALNVREGLRPLNPMRVEDDLERLRAEGQIPLA